MIGTSVMDAVRRRRPAAHIVLGVDFHPRDAGIGIEHRLMMLKAQSDPGLRRDWGGSAGRCQRHEARSPHDAVSLPP